MKIKQWPLLASQAEPSGSASRAWISLPNQRISTWAPQCRADAANALLMPKGPTTSSHSTSGCSVGQLSTQLVPQGEPNWATGTQRNNNWVLGSTAEESQTAPCVISHGLPSLFKGSRKKAQPSGVLLWVSKWSVSFLLFCIPSLLDGIHALGRGLATAGHTQTMQEREEQVPYQRAGHAHPIQAWQTWVPIAACNTTISLFKKK